MQRGGSGPRFIPAFVSGDKNFSVTKTQQQLAQEAREFAEAKNARENARPKVEPQPMFELKINQPPTAAAPPPPSNTVYPATFVPVANPFDPLAPYAYHPWNFQPNNVPVIKKYNISLGNGDITKIAQIYEDLLPREGDVVFNTYNTIKERMIISSYIRSKFNQNGEGERIDVLRKDQSKDAHMLSNLLSYMKILDFNPYHRREAGIDNPFKTIAKNFAFYRSCYPIKLEDGNQITCSKDNVGTHIRIYKMSRFDELALGGFAQSAFLSDIARELHYYKTMRDLVVSKKVAPNFVMMYCYYFAVNTGINFAKIAEFSTATDPSFQKSLEWLKDKSADAIINGRDADLRLPPNTKDETQALISVTEAPTMSIIDWMRHAYDVNGPIRKMKYTGFHTTEAWMSVIFQLVMAIVTLLEQDMFFTEFSLEDNVFIKDLKHDATSIGCWKYTFNGIEYFVPNFGDLVMLDSRFKDLDSAVLPAAEIIQREEATKFLASLSDKLDKLEACRLTAEDIKAIGASMNANEDDLVYLTRVSGGAAGLDGVAITPEQQAAATKAKAKITPFLLGASEATIKAEVNKIQAYGGWAASITRNPNIADQDKLEDHITFAKNTCKDLVEALGTGGKKMIGPAFGDDGAASSNNFLNMVDNYLKKAFDISEIKKHKGVLPDEATLTTMFNEIKSAITDAHTTANALAAKTPAPTFDEVFKTYVDTLKTKLHEAIISTDLAKFVHNRVGTYVSDTELKAGAVPVDPNPDSNDPLGRQGTKIGDLICIQRATSLASHHFGIFGGFTRSGSTVNANTVEVYEVKNGPTSSPAKDRTLVKRIYPVSRVKHYVGPVEQVPVNGKQFNELEHYAISWR